MESDDFGDPTAAVDGLYVDEATEAVDPADEPEDSAAAPSHLRPAHEPLPERERRFGRYTLLRRLAYGGMGEIFLARQGGAGSLAGVAKLVVIKRILAHMRRDEKHRRMFLDEARLQALLNNPHVVQIYDMGEEDGHVYLAMEHVLGPSWRMIVDRMRRTRSNVPIAHACAMVSQAARGLSYAHNVVDVSGAPLRIIHRDINPHNLLVTYDGEVKIIDFGIAKSELQEGNTETGTIKGKFNYMSPEQSAAKRLDHRSDLFTLGICLQELLTNENPFRRTNVVLSLEAIQKEPAVRLARRRPDAGLLQPIVDRCLAKDPDERYADAIFLSDELDELVASGAVPAPPEPLSSWLRKLFSDEIAEHMQILEETGSANAMVRRDDASSQRLRAAPRTMPASQPPADIADIATKVNDSPLGDDPSFDVDSMPSEEALAGFADLPDDHEGTAATPSGMSLSELTAPPATSFDPFAGAPAAGPVGAMAAAAASHASAQWSSEPGDLDGSGFDEHTSVGALAVRRPRAPLLAASAVVLVALGGVAALFALGVFSDAPAAEQGDAAAAQASPPPLAKAEPADAPASATPGAAAGDEPPPPQVTPPIAAKAAVEASPEAKDGETALNDHDLDQPEPDAAKTPAGVADAAAMAPPAPAAPREGRSPRPERAGKKKKEERIAAAAPLLGTFSVGAEGYTVKGRRKVLLGELSTVAVGGGPFEVRLSVRATSEDNATLTVESEPWAAVFVDSMGKGRTPLAGIALPAGKRLRLTLKSPKVPEPMSVSVTWTPGGG